MLEAKKAALLADEAAQKKPEHIRAQIVDGQLKKWYAEVVPDRAALPRHGQDAWVTWSPTAIATIGENIRVRRFARYALGEEL